MSNSSAYILVFSDATLPTIAFFIACASSDRPFEESGSSLSSPSSSPSLMPRLRALSAFTAASLFTGVAAAAAAGGDAAVSDELEFDADALLLRAPGDAGAVASTRPSSVIFPNFFSTTLMILSSTLFSTTSLMISTERFCPRRCTRPTACLSSAGLKLGSMKNTRFACVRLIPTAPDLSPPQHSGLVSHRHEREAARSKGKASCYALECSAVKPCRWRRNMGTCWMTCVNRSNHERSTTLKRKHAENDRVLDGA
mmetsp:Transcript_12007/g.33040  ORF Transcript_12007/g.33040 Transcript_12007/m.33040 type:complete len:255 (-) Transcript_12007:36-800(-)